MDRHDEQFEAYLRQFRLHKPSPLPDMESLKRRSATRWALAAAALVLTVGVLSIMVFRNGSSGMGAKATIEAAGNPSLYGVGQTIDAGNVVRSNSAVGLVLALEDGSHVEMRSQSQLVLESAKDGIRVRLNEGGILVTAAKQGAGHLYVQTRDSIVSVVGTVFFVSAEQTGTRVAVVEGEVHVQQGAELKKLMAGEQVASNPSLKLNPVTEEISWSQNAAVYVAKLTPSFTAVLPPKPSLAKTEQQATVSSQAPSDPPRDNPGKKIFDRACTTCHSAEIAMNLRSIEPQLSISDQALMIENHAAMAKLRTTLRENNEHLRQLVAEMIALETRVAVAKAKYADYVSIHAKAYPGVVSDSEITAIVNYWTDIMLSRKLADPIPSDLPLQGTK